VTRLEDIREGVLVQGVTPEGVAKILKVEWYGDQAIKVTYEDDDGLLNNRLVYRSDEESFRVVTSGGSCSFDGDGELLLRGDGGGRAEVTVVLTQKVTDKTLPGEYRCKDVTVYNTHYNYTTFAPETRFRVENYLGDHEGPKLVGWRVSKQ